MIGDRGTRQVEGANQPATDRVGDLRCRGFGELEQLLAAAADSEPLVERIANQINPMGLAASTLQSDAKICWKSWHRAPPLVACLIPEADSEIAISIDEAVYCCRRRETRCQPERRSATHNEDPQ